jgi:hypothetical protein
MFCRLRPDFYLLKTIMATVRIKQLLIANSELDREGTVEAEGQSSLTGKNFRIATELLRISSEFLQNCQLSLYHKNKVNGLNHYNYEKENHVFPHSRFNVIVR